MEKIESFNENYDVCGEIDAQTKKPKLFGVSHTNSTTIISPMFSSIDEARSHARSLVENSKRRKAQIELDASKNESGKSDEKRINNAEVENKEIDKASSIAERAEEKITDHDPSPAVEKHKPSSRRKLG
ncbi:hypothetical protein RM152_00645 [Pantoea agglomerans]|uniref:hypothetical protein n=1 Tax=Enterobacter agglomerans TaxID=549 RepID=UPI00289742CA|nr:hypothetical protein [Pantoea agglomerans]WNK62602.1 hypothetical protein RM152_00645 [Pantoea agglomerans]